MTRHAGNTLATTVVIALLGSGPAASVMLPAFPGAEGFGAHTPGGRAGRALLVTNLSDFGPGSLRAACEAKGPRIVVFRVSGVIELRSPLVIEQPFITIAGQTSPGGGICLKNYAVVVRRTHDVIMRHLRIRPGDVMKKEQDALSVYDARNVIVDHCSTSWGTDETLSVTKDSSNITVQWCMITESLNRSYHHKGAHGYGSLIVSSDGGVTFHHNVYAHHSSRNPRPGGYADKPGILLDFRNNLIYNWGRAAGYNGQYLVRMNYVGNYLKPGPSTDASARGVAFRIGGPLTALFLRDNVMEGFPKRSQSNWLMVVSPPGLSAREAEAKLRARKPFPAAPVGTDSPLTAYRRALANAGATLPIRDAVDARVIQEIKTAGGGIIDSQADVGGWPAYPQADPPADTDLDGMPDAWERRYGLNAKDASDNTKDSDGDGYTNIEEFLNGTNPRETD